MSLMEQFREQEKQERFDAFKALIVALTGYDGYFNPEAKKADKITAYSAVTTAADLYSKGWIDAEQVTKVLQAFIDFNDGKYCKTIARFSKGLYKPDSQESLNIRILCKVDLPKMERLCEMGISALNEEVAAEEEKRAEIEKSIREKGSFLNAL